MPSCKQKTIIKSFRLRIQNKFRNIAAETENVTSLLQSCVTRFDDRVKQLLQIDDENFLTLYEKLNHDFESYQETLCFTQTSIEGLIEGETDESEIVPETDDEDVNSYATEDRSLQHLANPILHNLCPTDNSSVVYENLLPSTCEDTPSVDIWCKQNSLSSSRKNDQPLDVQFNQSEDESQVNLYTETFSSNSAFTDSYCSVSLSNKSLASKSDQPLDVQCNQSKDESQANLHTQTFSSNSAFTDSHFSVSLSNKNIMSKDDQPLDVPSNQNKNKSQINLYAQTFSSNSAFTDSYCSVSLSNKNLVYPSGALQKHSPPSLTTESFKSLSQGSCYRSLSSNFSELDNLVDSTSIIETNLKQNVNLPENESHLQSNLHTKDVGFELSIPSLSITVPSNISATLTHVIDPGNFWMQLENSHSFEFDFPVSKYVHEKHPTSAKKGSFYLAPFKMTSFYYRAEALNSANSEEEDVKVFFIDHGSTQNVLLQDLRLLPWPAYDIPKQAIHCYLYGILPIKLFWPSESIQKMKEFQNFFIETIVKLRNGDKYGVQLTAKVEAGIDEEYSADIAQLLCLDGLAIQNEQNPESNQVAKCNKVEDEASREDPNCHSNDATFCSTDNRISCDSGVSVTSFYRHSSISADVDFSCDSLNNCSNSRPNVLLPTSIKETKVNQKNQLHSLVQSDQGQTIDLISFESIEGRLDGSLSKTESSNCITVDNNALNDNNALDITIPFPSITFVEKGMMLVMLSDIVTPSEFYVNMAMENIINLDDLREQMTTTYSLEIHSSLAPEDLQENMFCAAHFDKDMNWYRVKILSILSVTDGIALIQYVDYGNKAIMKCQSLRPLKPEFAKHPSFAIKCSLAGVTPPNTKDIQSAGSWNEAAVSEFKKLTSYERCLTAQICEEVFNLESEPLQVLLWDTEGTEDVLINSALAVSGVAEFDSSILTRIFPEVKSKEEINDLDSWDPLSEEYNDIENSYGVDMDDLEVAISGQKFNDDSYTCKYFSLRGHCPRGNNCPYLHVPVAETGVTRDLEEVYSLDTMPLIPENVCYLFVEVSSVVSPSQFHVILPFGSKSVHEIDSLLKRGTSLESLLNQEPKTLYSAMSDHYSKAPFKENTKVALACGSIVAAKRHLDQKWHRGRVIDATDTAGPAQIFFVDFGDKEWVPRKLIREILPEYLHTPFQAIECTLSDIEPVNHEKGTFWSESAIKTFMQLVERQVLIAHITYRLGKVLHVTLMKTSRENKSSIGDYLVSAGYAQYQCPQKTSSAKKEILFIPG